MKRIEFLKQKIDSYLVKEQLLKKQEYTKLEKPFLIKARKSYTIANLMFKISEQNDFKKALVLPESFEAYEWVIIVSYYSMYASALAALVKMGFKSKSHAATIAVLEHYYVKGGKLEPKHVNTLSKAYMLSENLIAKLVRNKARRESAQYDATPAISRETAKTALSDADEFITRVEEALGA